MNYVIFKTLGDTYILLLAQDKLKAPRYVIK